MQRLLSRAEHNAFKYLKIVKENNEIKLFWKKSVPQSVIDNYYAERGELFEIEDNDPYRRIISSAKRSEVISFMNEIIEIQAGIPVKEIFIPRASFSHPGSKRQYMSEEPLYIVFENDRCLVIDYMCIEYFSAEFRMIDENVERKVFIKELNNYPGDYGKDAFNNHITVCQSAEMQAPVDRELDISMKYDTLKSFTAERYTEEYYTWSNRISEPVQPTEETFCNIEFVMSNGNIITVFPYHALDDGYMSVTSSGSFEIIKKKMTVKYVGKPCISLINGKQYEVISIEDGWYRIFDETEDDYLFPPEEFSIVSEGD